MYHHPLPLLPLLQVIAMIIYSQKYYNKYNQIVKHYKNLDLKKSKELYTESHHIIPKSMGGLDTEENLVRVPARVHFLLHWMLYRIYKTNTMILAWNRMCQSKTSQRYTSKSFLYVRHSLSMIMSDRIVSDETKEKLSIARRKRICTDETRIKIGLSHKGKTVSAAAKLKMSISNSGTNNSMHGKKHSAESKKKMSVKAKNRAIKTYTCPHCAKVGKGPAMLGRHFDKCALRLVNELNV